MKKSQTFWESSCVPMVLGDVLATDKAMVLWRKVQRAGYVDEHYQPLLSQTQVALLADAIIPVP